MPGRRGELAYERLGVKRGAHFHVIIKVHEHIARNTARRVSEYVVLFRLATPRPFRHPCTPALDGLRVISTRIQLF